MVPSLSSALVILFASASVVLAGSGESDTSAVDDTYMAEAEPGYQPLCVGYGPQTPRDIGLDTGVNVVRFPMAPPSSELNLCNIHLHAQAEHKGPDYMLYAGPGAEGGFQCNATASLTAAELEDPTRGRGGAFGGVFPGDTIEVHWVFTSCDVKPGPGLGACLSSACANPTLRVEAQVFLLVNDPDALNFDRFVYAGRMAGGYHQPLTLPTEGGEPVVFGGSTTGPSYSRSQCSPLQVTWSVRPKCAKLDIGSLHRWAASGNVFEETEPHGVRPLVSAPTLLAPLDAMQQMGNAEALMLKPIDGSISN